MKKTYLLFSALLCLATGATQAQYTILHSFNNTTGGVPLGALTLSGNTLYGMANSGGSNGLGCIFSLDTNGNNYLDIFDFAGTDGAYPQGGTLKLLGNRLFGMTFSGGANDSGCVFSIKTDGTSYKDLLDFTGPNGAAPYGSLVISGTKMFGTTYTGGANVMGNLFTIDTAGKNYKDLHDFSGTDGSNPYGDFTIIGDKLYSMAATGGTNGYGNVFSIDSNGTNYTDLFDFNGTNGAYPNNILTLAGTQFFGVTNGGGASSLGNVFSMDTAGTDFKDLADMSGTVAPVGSYPLGDVILSGKVLYGMTSGGGVNDSGCIYSVDTAGNNYTDLYDFNTANGAYPYSNVTFGGNTMFGTASANGPGSQGVVFKFTPTPLGIKNIKNNATVKLYPNPNNGSFTLHTTAAIGVANVEIYNSLGELVYTSALKAQTDNAINMSGQAAGIYLYRLVTENGELLGQGKFVVE